MLGSMTSTKPTAGQGRRRSLPCPFLVTIVKGTAVQLVSVRPPLTLSNQHQRHVHGTCTRPGPRCRRRVTRKVKVEIKEKERKERTDEAVLVLSRPCGRRTRPRQYEGTYVILRQGPR